MTSADAGFAPESRSRSELCAQTLDCTWLAICMLTLDSTTISHIWLPHRGQQFIAGDTGFAPQSHCPLHTLRAGWSWAGGVYAGPAPYFVGVCFESW